MKYLFCLLNYGLLGLGLLTFTACEKVLDIQPDVQSGLVLASQQFSSDVAANDAVVGLYAKIYPTSSFTTYTANIAANAALSANELYYNDLEVNRTQFSLYSLVYTNGYLANYWTDSYAIINHANFIVERLSASTSVSADKKNQLIGEAKFIRAFCYFYLVNLFGDVPLVTTTDYRISSTLGRTPTTEVYAQMIRDLTEAEQQLPVGYATEGRVRANRAVAQALLARVYLYREDWAKAEEKATTLISNAQYALEPDFDVAFRKGSNEAIFQFWTQLGYTMFENQVGAYKDENSDYRSASYGVPEEMIQAFEADDQRKVAFLDTMTVRDVLVVFPSKYNVHVQGKDEAGFDNDEYDMVFRITEQYLIRAEARAQQGKIAEAVQDINLIRERAGLEGLSEGISKSTLLLAIEHERQVELCFEWGHRWFDLKRTKRADAVLGPQNPTWKPTAVLYPIPQSEMRVNIKLTQNPGY